MTTETQQHGQTAIIDVRGVSTRFGTKVVHDNISLQVFRGEILAIVGGSGSGKSTLMREMVMLERPTKGSVSVFGQSITGLGAKQALGLRQRIGVLFQNGALFSGLTVLDNVAVPLREHTHISDGLIRELASLKIALVGLTPDAAALYPGQLSGGMRKRAALARALALDPELLFLDEPSSGLDPISADGLDELVLSLRASLGLTIVMVTHDMDSISRVADRVVLLGQAKILAQGTVREVVQSSDPLVMDFFQGPRGRAAQGQT